MQAQTQADLTCCWAHIAGVFDTVGDAFGAVGDGIADVATGDCCGGDGCGDGCGGCDGGDCDGDDCDAGGGDCVVS